MTQEEKAKRYDKALERAREYKKHGYMMINVALDNIFPELKESDDERIRKALLELFSNVNKKDFRGIPTEKIIDWLERQSKETRWKPSKEEMEEDDVRRRSTIQVLEYARSLDSYNQYGKKDIDKNIAWLEKQVPIDIKKVEPKFHEGDWTVSNLDGNARQISEVHSDEHNSYYVINGKSVNLEEYDRLHHLWTIEDAKPGDVLVCKGNVKDSRITYERICLFENLNKAFFTLTKTSNGLEEYDINVNIDYPDNTVPATKKQKEILFMTMKEVGYKLDVEN